MMVGTDFVAGETIETQLEMCSVHLVATVALVETL